MHPLGLVVGIFIQEADKKLAVLPRCEFDCSHNQSPYGGNIKRFVVKSKGSIAFHEAVHRNAEDFYPHETFFLILSLASSQLDTVILPASREASRSLRMASCQAGDSSFFSLPIMSAQSVSIKSNFWVNESCAMGTSNLFIMFFLLWCYTFDV